MKKLFLVILFILYLLTGLGYARTTTTDLQLVKPLWTENVDILDDINANSDILEAFANDPLEFYSVVDADIPNDITIDLATLATTITVTDNESTNEENPICFVAGADPDGGSLGIETDGTMTYNPSTGVITTTGFAGTLTGNVTGTSSLATEFTVTDNENEALACPIIFVDGATGSQGAESDGDLTYNPSTGTLAVPALTVTGAIATATNISLTGELDLTGASATIDLNPAGQTTKDIITITPSATLNATQVWCAINIDGSALDPNGVDTEIIGYQVNLSGVDETNFPIIHGARLNVPFGSDALHIVEGQLHIDTVLPSTAASEFTNIDIVIDSSAMAATSEYHAIDVATTGTPAGEVVAVGTHTEVEVIHQHIATFTTPSQTEFAGVKHTGGTVWVDGIDAYGVIFAAVSDAIYVGAATQFDEIEVIMTTGGTKSIKPTFWYNTAADAWTQFFPADDTDGFQQSGEVRWEVAGITGSWTNDGDPGGADTTAGYYIKIVRTRVGTVGSPNPTTVKIGLVTEYKWDKAGNVVAKSFTGALTPAMISGLADVTSTDSDYILIWDATDSALKKCDMGEVRGAGGGDVTKVGTPVDNQIGIWTGDGTIEGDANLTYDGTTVILGTGQINFPDSQNASADANTLDDYEEGTWTPDLQFGGAKVNITYTTQAGLYTKIGRIVTVTCYILLSSKGSSTGLATINGLPFTCKNDSGAYSPIVPRVNVVSFADFVEGEVMANTTHVRMYEITNAGVLTNLDNTNFANNSSVVFSAVYFE